MNLSRILKFSKIYQLAQSMAGSSSFRRIFTDEYIRPRSGMRILDIGCGTAEILDFLPEVDYYGFDLSEKYIASARRHYGRRGHFEIAKVSEQAIEQLGTFDLILAIGVLHHLDDAEALQLFNLAKSGMKPDAVLITIDGCKVPGQSVVAAKIMSWDRGSYIRNEDSYRKLASQSFNHLECALRNDLLIIPFNHIIMRCSNH